jgi:predicted RND superfamily exporter protein
MLKRLAYFILKFRLPLIILIGLITVFMGYHASKIEITYHFAKLLPDNDQTSIDYEFFKKKFGQDGTVLVIGIQKDKLNDLKTYQAWAKLGDDIKQLDGIKGVVSIARLSELVLNDSLGKFQFVPVAGSNPSTQGELEDHILKINSLKFYEGIVYNSKTNSSLMAITFFEKDLNSKRRLEIVDNIKNEINKFNESTQIDTYESGLPFIRTTVMRKIRDEMSFFLGVALIVTALLLFIFFRSLYPVVFSLLVIACGVITSLGTIVLMGYKLSVLSGLIPPLIIVIGVPNCILILNKYHTEIAEGKNKMVALHLAIQRASVSLFFANITTSIGFAVFCAIQNKLLFEFGLVSSINVLATFLYSIILVPAIFSYLPTPEKRHLRHLDGRRLTLILDKVAEITQHHRKTIYVTVSAICVISFIGLMKIRAHGYVVDDIPKTDVLKTDLKYFEENYGGVLPFEITIDTRRPNGVFANSARCLYRINRAQKLIGQYKEFSRPVSIVDGVKFLYQSYKGGDEKYYKLPPVTELKTIAEYVKTEKEKANQLSAFIDPEKQTTRITVYIADCGSTRVAELTSELKPRLDSIFNYDDDEKKWMQVFSYDELMKLKTEHPESKIVTDSELDSAFIKVANFADTKEGISEHVKKSADKSFIVLADSALTVQMKKENPGKEIITAPTVREFDVKLTGNSIVFLKGNEFLVNNLIESVALAIILIAIFMLTLFTSFRMILISTVPSLVALLITAGLMGYLGIPLKPSTILVFSIAFGISSDGTLYFLTKYRHEIKKNKLSIGNAVRLTISETGISMVYTAIVLFFGFGMFALSGFGGTQALGVLISFTLIVGYCANLILLPAFLLSLEKKLTDKEFINSEGIIDSDGMVDEKDDV